MRHAIVIEKVSGKKKNEESLFNGYSSLNLFLWHNEFAINILYILLDGNFRIRNFRFYPNVLIILNY